MMPGVRHGRGGRPAARVHLVCAMSCISSSARTGRFAPPSGVVHGCFWAKSGIGDLTVPAEFAREQPGIWNALAPRALEKSEPAPVKPSEMSSGASGGPFPGSELYSTDRPLGAWLSGVFQPHPDTNVLVSMVSGVPLKSPVPPHVADRVPWLGVICGTFAFNPRATHE
jgi:hypothetical protein